MRHPIPPIYFITCTVEGKNVAAGLQDILVCEVGGQRFGLPGSVVRELLRTVAIRPLPQSPRFVEGVINLRGVILPVLDVRQWLNLPPRAVEPEDHLVVVQTEERLAVIRIDRAVELVRVEAVADDYSGESGASTRVVKLADGLLVIPDLAALLPQINLPKHASEIAETALGGEGPP